MTSTLEALRHITTGTITTMLLKKGIRRSWMAGAMPFGFSGKRIVGPAFTLRFVPVREDLATPESWSKPISTRSAIEAMPENCVVVADAMGVTGAGIFGDILCMRMVKRGVSALITDGVMRDKHGVIATNLPVWCAGVAAPASVNQLTFVGWNEPIGCGGCAIFPDDIIVADDDGRGGDPGRACRFRRQRRRRARADGNLAGARGGEGREAPRPLSAQRREQEALRRVEEEALISLWACRRTLHKSVIFFSYGRFAARVRVSVLVRHSRQRDCTLGAAHGFAGSHHPTRRAG